MPLFPVRCPTPLTRPVLRRLIAAILFVGALWLLPAWWCGRDAAQWLGPEAKYPVGLSREVAATIKAGVSENDFTNATSLFRNEWKFGTYQMGALGLLQVIRAHPETRAEFMPAVEQAIDRLLSPGVRAFDQHMWQEDPLDSLEGPNGHTAYLGYLNLVLTLHRQLVPDSRYAPLNDRISAALARRIAASAHGILETYPGEAYPIDNAAGLTSLILHQRLTHADHTAAIQRVLTCYRSYWREPRSGLLYQAIGPHSGQPQAGPRASGTALAATFLAIAERDVSAQLFESIRSQLAGSFLRFGYIREYPAGWKGAGDVDSGPVIFGASISGTGFTLATARAFGDTALFTSLFRTSQLVGVPVWRGDRLTYATGGPLGNSILLAMLTAPSSPP